MRKFYNKLLDYVISPNQLYIMYCIREQLEAKFVNLHVELRALRTLQYLDKNNKLTFLGSQILLDCESMMKVSVTKETVIERDYLHEYYEMWPRIKLPTGKYARVDKKNLETAFKWFFKTYSYSWDVVLKATAVYLDEYEAKNWAYMRTSQYFIRKVDSDKSITSELANYCNIIESGQDPNADNKNHFPDKVV